MEKIFLICPALPSQMPYVQNYINVLEKLQLEYSLIVWDRKRELNCESPYYVFQDTKLGLTRGFGDYYMFSKFFKNLLKSYEGSYVIAFGIPVLFFCGSKFFNKFKCIADIRDYHAIIRVYFSLGRDLSKACLTALSSDGFRKWLPNDINYVISHNTNFKSAHILDAAEISKCGMQRISCIGALKDFDVLHELLINAKYYAEPSLQFKFHGEGIINEQLRALKNLVPEVSIIITDKYQKHEEIDFYSESDWINMFMSSSNINNSTCLSNRLYNAVFYGKPLLCYEGSYLSCVIKKFNLGIVFTDVHDFFNNFRLFANAFDFHLYNEGRLEFFKSVDFDNMNFEQSLKSILAPSV